jgi:hypothetical protein
LIIVKRRRADQALQGPILGVCDAPGFLLPTGFWERFIRQCVSQLPEEIVSTQHTRRGNDPGLWAVASRFLCSCSCSVTLQRMSLVNIRVESQQNPVGDEVSAITAVVRPILEGLLYAR